MSDQYAVIGNPIEHSKSPQIHTFFAQQTQQDLQYTKILATDFKKTAENFFEQGGQGLNITVPFKGDAFEFADECSNRAKKAQAVNTLKKLDNGQIFGDNTDGIGLVQDLTINHQYILKNKKILILGAGGAARGVIPSLLKTKPQRIYIANRTVAKAVALIELDPLIIKGGGYDELNGQVFDLIINATSTGLSGRLPPISKQLLKINSLTYDMMYSVEDTTFVTWSKQQGITKALDGLGMLVEQAAAAFELWRGVKPDTQEIQKILRK